MLHSDVDDGIINRGGRPLLFLRCSRCGMEFAFCLDSDRVVMLMPGPIH